MFFWWEGGDGVPTFDAAFICLKPKFPMSGVEDGVRAVREVEGGRG